MFIPSSPGNPPERQTHTCRLASFYAHESGSSVRSMVGSTGRDLALYVLHLGRNGGAGQLAAKGIPAFKSRGQGDGSRELS